MNKGIIPTPPSSLSGNVGKQVSINEAGGQAVTTVALYVGDNSTCARTRGTVGMSPGMSPGMARLRHFGKRPVCAVGRPEAARACGRFQVVLDLRSGRWP